MAKVVTFIVIFAVISILMNLAGFSNNEGNIIGSVGISKNGTSNNTVEKTECSIKSTIWSEISSGGNPVSGCKDSYWAVKFAILFLGGLSLAKFLLSGIQGIDLIASAAIALVSINFSFDMLNVLTYLNTIGAADWIVNLVYLIIAPLYIMFLYSLWEWVRGDH